MDSSSKLILKRGLILFLIIAAIIYFLNSSMVYFAGNESFSIINSLNSVDEDSIDVFIMGNSHAQEGISAEIMSDISGLNVYNYAFSQQTTGECYYFLKQIFKNQSPDFVVLGAYSMIQHYENGADLLPFSFDKIQYYMMQKDEMNFTDTFFPLLRLHSFWANEDMLSQFKDTMRGETEYTPAYDSSLIMNTMVQSEHKTRDSFSIRNVLVPSRFEHVKKIKDLCEQNGAELIIVMIPWYDTLVNRTKYEQEYYTPISDFCILNDIPYFDMNMEGSTEWDYRYFRDQGYTVNNHLNIYGQYQATCNLSFFLSNQISPFAAASEGGFIMSTEEYFCNIRSTDDILIIDDSHALINEAVKSKLSNELLRLNIVLPYQESTGTETLYISGGALVDNYYPGDSVEYMSNAVNIFVIDSLTGEVLSHAITRWDIFDEVFIK